MLATPQKEEIDHRTIKLLVGLIALSLGSLTKIFSQTPITSISESYYEGGWSQSIFVGFLFAIAALLVAYNGLARREMILSKIASAAALGVALFPCNCAGHDEIIPRVHAISAGIMFLILVYFCYVFFQRARTKGYPEAKIRAAIYAICGIAIALSILTIGIDNLTHGSISARFKELTFYGEAAALIAFGISWLTASRVFPVITRKEERFSPFNGSTPQ
jgi:hypothetical protein